MRWLTTLCLALTSLGLTGQPPSIGFRSPVDYPTRLSGSFAEPRTRHFHAGVDFKPLRGVPLDTIRAVADGYISRINVTPDGYGNALYIDHENGYTSVYAHLHEFRSDIREYIDNKMYALKKYRIEHYPKNNILRVRKGDPIGIMGNTGRSSAAHLHFELRETNQQIPVNPSIFGIGPPDNIPPTINGLMIYYLTPDDELVRKKYFPAVKNGSSIYALEEDLVECGALMVGLGIETYDMMNGASNHNGIYGLDCTVDGTSIFSFKLNKITFGESKYIHSHMDYHEKLNRRYISRCYREEANPLPFYQTDQFLGKIYLFEDIPRHVAISVKDYKGNSSVLSFYVKRKKVLQSFDSLSADRSVRIVPSDSLSLTYANHLVEFSPNTFTSPFHFVQNEGDSLHLNFTQSREIPLFKSFKITSRLDVDEHKRTRTKFTSLNEDSEIVHYGGAWINDTTMVTTVNELKNYAILEDSLPPAILMTALPGEDLSKIEFTLKDNFIPANRSDQIKFNVYLDGQWLLCSQDAKTNKIWCDLKIERLNQEHRLRIWAKDSANNEITISRSFTY